MTPERLGENRCSVYALSLTECLIEDDIRSIQAFCYPEER